MNWNPCSRPGRARTWARWLFPALAIDALITSLALSPPAAALRPSPKGTPASVTDAAAGVVSAVRLREVSPGPFVAADLLGISGKLRALIGTPEELTRNPLLEPLLAGLPLDVPGVHRLPAAAPDGDSLSVLSLLPFGKKSGAQLAGYRIGFWPTDALTARNPRYRFPEGLIPVTPQSQSTNVSKHFLLRDFLTHDQAQAWPKFLVLRPALLDKLELIHDELEREGLPSRLHVMSGFRTPQYNALEVGKGGRASHSRHMYGDAADVFVDADGNGVMDDVNGDGKISVLDARALLRVAERVESRHPELVGGLSAYPANAVHGPFVHVDARGVKARW